MGLGRAKRPYWIVSLEAKAESASGRHRGEQRPNAEDIHCPGQIVGQNRERHFGGYPWQSFGQEVHNSSPPFSHSHDHSRTCNAPELGQFIR
jgi:hypothetical protein